MTDVNDEAAGRTRVGFGTSRRPGSEAWVDVEIYAMPDGTYEAVRSGFSNRYHAPDTRCMTRGRQRGEPASVDDLPDDAVPCKVCRPPYPEDLPEGPGAVRYEVPRHVREFCATPRLVYDRLTMIRNHDGTRTFQESKPVRDAVRDAAVHDGRFAEFMRELEEAAR